MADKVTLCDERLQHIAFIMDGNGRWAKKRGMPREYGHKVGAKVFKEVIKYCGDIGIKYVTVYAFSTENWKRSEKEVSSIMKLLGEYIKEAEGSADGGELRVKFLGDLSKLPKELEREALRLEKMTENCPQTVNIALNYGGRAEIVEAVNRLISQGETSITEKTLSASLYTAGMPDPDLIVRTGGEFRLSNFLMWQSAYSELYFTNTLWPDMKSEDVDAAVSEFYRRTRRYGGVTG
ncbi:MAG: di-trans,poly-cis-decaprenylcistransferase [Ruminococcaceae bacterium]|nr:di-trans,poly-cis-decaprenylcistransferase [Oscillospiraceae bacterium]